MSQLSGQSGGPEASPRPASAEAAPGAEPERPGLLAIETILVTLGVLVVVRLLDGRSASGLRWLFVPGVLVAAALSPTYLGKRAFPRIRFDPQRYGQTLRLVAATSVLVVGVAFLGLWLMTRLDLPIPLKPTIARRSDWLSWLLYQLLYVAVAEEVFFRGYVQVNVMRIFERLRWCTTATQQWATIVISAACFAVAHVAVQGRMIALLTFGPGLLLAWLFLRTGSLLAPILLHGLANITYGVIASNLA